MGLFDNLFDKAPEPKNNEPKHSVIIHFDYGLESMDPFYALEEQLMLIVEETGVGEFDGHEIAMDNSDGFFYMYGPNAETLFKAVKPVLDEIPFMKGAVAKLRFGPPGEDVPEIDLEL